MNRSFYKGTAALLAVCIVLPLFSSCSLFAKSKILEKAGVLSNAVKTADASDILDCTDGLEKDFKKSFKAMLNKKNYSEEHQKYNEAVLESMTIEPLGDTVKVNKDKATCTIEFTRADIDKLKDGQFQDANELANAVEKCDTKTISVDVEFSKIEKEWLITNFDDSNFQDVFSFYNNMPPIGRRGLIQAATQTAKTVTMDDYGVAALLVGPDITPEQRDYIKSVFAVDSKVTEEEKAFRAAVLESMSYEVDEKNYVITETSGEVDIRITMADYELLAGKSFNSIPEIEAAVKSCGTKTYTFKAKFVRDRYDWYIVNIDADEYAGMLSYKKFSISLKTVEGTYKAANDITKQFTAYVASEYNVKMPADLTGTIVINSTLVLKDGKYEVKIDRDGFVKNIKTFVETNIDKIIMATLGTTSSTGLDALAKIGGYKNYDDMKQQILNEVTTSLEKIDTSSLDSAGTYTISDNVIHFRSGPDIMEGRIDNYGNITVNAPVKDADAKKLLGSDTITLVFKKV